MLVRMATRCSSLRLVVAVRLAPFVLLRRVVMAGVVVTT